MAFQLLDEIISSCAELHSLLSVCSPEEVDMEDMNDHLQKLLPMIPCEKSSNSGCSGQTINPNKEKKAEATTTNLMCKKDKKQQRAQINAHGLLGEFPTYDFGVRMEEEVYSLADQKLMRSNSQDVHSFLQNHQFLHHQQEVHRKCQANVFLASQFYLQCEKASEFQFSYSRPGKHATIKVTEAPIPHLYLDRHVNLFRHFELITGSERKPTILFIHKSKQLVALTLDLGILSKQGESLLGQKPSTLTMEYSPFQLASIGLKETVLTPHGSYTSFCVTSQHLYALQTE